MKIRRAVPTDLEVLTELHRQFCEHDQHSFDAARAWAGFTPLLADDTHGVVLVTAEPAGYAVLTWGWSIEAGGSEAVLDEIYVSAQGHGHGAALLDEVIAHAEEFMMQRIVLETERHNTRVRSFYDRHDFVEDDSIWMTLDLRVRAPGDRQS